MYNQNSSPITLPETEQSTKEEYFEHQALLDVSDDEQNFPNKSMERIAQAMADSKAMPSPALEKQRSSFLGPTPKERRAAFEAHTTKQRPGMRETSIKLTRSSTAPQVELTKSILVPKSRDAQNAKPKADNKLKRLSSLPEMGTINQTPFYKRLGIVPRELKNGKNVKPADSIKLELEHKQLLKDKIIYFYPNDDISMVRRTRIHKVIQLGAAWVNRWRDDVTHIMLDDASYTYSQLLRHLNKMSLPVSSSKLYP
jgi:DNA polymerase IV